MNILIGVTGSVATIKLPLLIQQLRQNLDGIEVRIVTTECGKHFIPFDQITDPIFDDDDEWSQWRQRGDPVLHIELAKWAELFLIAPLDANTLAKIAGGICDNLITCICRAWLQPSPASERKPRRLVVCPAMNTAMWNHPITSVQLALLQSWGYHAIMPIEKTLICGDTGMGAMATVEAIVEALLA